MIQDIGSERSVLAGLVKYGFRAYVNISDILNIKCFTTELNQMLYRCIELVLSTNEEADVALIYSAAHTLGFDSQINSTDATNFIRALYSFPIEFNSIRPIAEKIVVLKVAREAQDLHKQAYDKLSFITGKEPLSDLLSISEVPYSNLLHSLTGEDDIQPAAADIDDYYESLLNRKEGAIGIPSPFPIWNYCIGGGLRPGVHLTAGRAKVGKSSIAKETAIHASLNLQIPTLYIDTEMSKEEQDNRILAGLSLVNVEEIEDGSFRKNPAKKNRVAEAVEKYKQAKYFHKNVAGKDFKSILADMARWIHKYVGITNGVTNPHLIIYDYFKLMNAEGLKEMQEYQAMGFQIAAMHDFCQKYQTPIMSFVQINRDGINRDGTDIISQSDRLVWNAISVSIYRRKSAEEVAEDGVDNGNVKLLPLEGRFMKRLDDGDYINMNFKGEFASLKELKTRNMLKNG